MSCNKLFFSPFVFKFEENEESCLLFNTFNLSLVRVKKSIYDKVVKCLEDVETYKNDEEIKGVIEELRKRDFLLEFKVDATSKRSLLEYTYFLTRAGSNVLSLWLSLTSNCNMACPYCYLSQKPGRDITNTEAEAIIKFVESTLRENKNVSTLSIVYFGGEPLLNKQVLIKLHAFFCELAKKENISYSSLIITNGTLLNEALVQELNEIRRNCDTSAITFQVTLDGFGETHNRRRPLKNGDDSFSLIYNNFVRLVKDDNIRNVALRSNVDNENIESVKKLYNNLRESLGFNISKINVGLSWTYPSQSYYLRCPTYEIFPNRDQALKLLELYRYAKSLGFKISPLIFTVGPCGVTNVHNYAIDESLKVYKCPGLFYTDKNFGIIHENGSLEVPNPINLIQYIGDLNKCYLNCKFGALCYGGCRVMKHCPKEYFETFVSKEGIRLLV